jgi:hypothetical protein
MEVETPLQGHWVEFKPGERLMFVSKVLAERLINLLPEHVVLIPMDTAAN